MRLIRELLWSRALRNARWDEAYYRSGMLYYAMKLREAKRIVAAIERAKVDVDYPVRGR